MNRALSLLICCAATFGLHGCGPMQMPMPVRPNDESQRAIDQSWDEAMRPVNRLTHQPLLDVLLVTKGYQAGVDKLSFRSEKKVAAGTVVMEIEYDRLKPDQDRFSVKIYDPAQKLLREETYSRKEIEDANNDLFVRVDGLKTKVNAGQATPDEVKQLAALEARMKAVVELSPKISEPDEERVRNRCGSCRHCGRREGRELCGENSRTADILRPPAPDALNLKLLSRVQCTNRRQDRPFTTGQGATDGLFTAWAPIPSCPAFFSCLAGGGCCHLPSSEFPELINTNSSRGFSF